MMVRGLKCYPDFLVLNPIGEYGGPKTPTASTAMVAGWQLVFQALEALLMMFGEVLIVIGVLIAITGSTTLL